MGTGCRSRVRLSLLVFLAAGCGDNGTSALRDASATDGRAADGRADSRADARTESRADGPAIPGDGTFQGDGARLDGKASLDKAPLPDQVVLPAVYFHVRAGATGAGNGSSWTDAFVPLPATLVRGATYYVAAGS